MSLPSAGKRIFAIAAVGAVTVALFACGAADEPNSEQSAGEAADGSIRSAQLRPEAALDGASTYVVDTEASEIYWLLGKTGPLAAAAGHHHVISAEVYEGTVFVDPEDASRSRFELVFPVAAFVVDDPELRMRLGADFESVPSENDIAGTKRNMLSEDLLNAPAFPALRVSGNAPQAGSDTLPVQIEIVGRTFDLDLPATVSVDEQTIEARGEFTLSHADLGLEPFSLPAGVLSVANEIGFSYRIVAQRSAD